MKENGIVVLGPVFVDIKGYPLDNYISAGRNSGRVEFVHGGVSRNIVEDMANVELRPTFVSLVDETGTGDDVIRQLSRHRVNTRYIRRVKDGMGTWLAIFDNSGDVVASISKRPDVTPLIEVLQEHGDEIFSRCDSISLEIDMDRDIVKRVFNYAEKYGKDVYAVISNMTVGVQRRDYIRRSACLVCNIQEAGIFFSENYNGYTTSQMQARLKDLVKDAGIKSMVVTMGSEGAVWADLKGNSGYCPPVPVDVKDTTGAGDAFFAGVCMGLTYGRNLADACVIGARLAGTVISTVENVCPRFEPAEFGLKLD